MGFIERSPLTGIDIVRMNSIRLTQFLQQGLGMRSSQTEMMRSISFMTDSTMSYFWIYPICTLIQPLLGIRLLFAITTTDWIVHLLKCIFPDDRPYWWFPYTQYSERGASHTTMYEFPETCEEVTSAFPSTRSAIFAATTYVIFSHVRNGLKSRQFSKPVFISGDAIVVSIFLMTNLTGIISRMLLATNFHYQLFAGFFIGSMVGKLTCSNLFDKFSLNIQKTTVYYCLVVQLSLVIIGMILYLVDADAFWPVPHALKWCWSLHYVYKSLKKNILFYTFRIYGTAAGFLMSNHLFGVRLPVAMHKWKQTAMLGAMYAVEIVTMYLIWRQMEFFSIPQFLCFSLFLHTGHTILISSALPIIVHHITHTSSDLEKSTTSRNLYKLFRSILPNKKSMSNFTKLFKK